MNIPKLYTVESVTAGHPDKVCDQISDAILDECLKHDSKSRVAVESFGGHGLIVIGGEVTTKAELDFEAVARRVYRGIGYREPVKILVNIARQSLDIAQGVDTGGAGDQGIMYGFATNETPEFLPKGIVAARKLTRKLEELRQSGEIDWLGPDGKSQVTVAQGKIRTILVSTQHQEKVNLLEIRRTLITKIIRPIVGGESGVEILVNPTGRFVQGGFAADTGLTGRKIMVDTYGGLISHGGGCFSGKDPTKVDRSGAYMARFAAKNLVAAGYAEECLVSVAYAIGRAEPVMIEARDEAGKSLGSLARKRFDFRPTAIIERLNLQRPIYQETAAHGHFGNPDFPWEVILA